MEILLLLLGGYLISQAGKKPADEGGGTNDQGIVDDGDNTSALDTQIGNVRRGGFLSGAEYRQAADGYLGANASPYIPIDKLGILWKWKQLPPYWDAPNVSSRGPIPRTILLRYVNSQAAGDIRRAIRISPGTNPQSPVRRGQVFQDWSGGVYGKDVSGNYYVYPSLQSQIDVIMREFGIALMEPPGINLNWNQFLGAAGLLKGAKQVGASIALPAGFQLALLSSLEWEGGYYLPAPEWRIKGYALGQNRVNGWLLEGPRGGRYGYWPSLDTMRAIEPGDRYGVLGNTLADKVLRDLFARRADYGEDDIRRRQEEEEEEEGNVWDDRVDPRQRKPPTGTPKEPVEEPEVEVPVEPENPRYI